MKLSQHYFELFIQSKIDRQNIYYEKWSLLMISAILLTYTNNCMITWQIIRKWK